MYLLTNHSARWGCDTRSIFKRSFNRFEFNLLSPMTCAILRLKSPTCLQFIHSWRDSNWMHTNSVGISGM